MKIRHKISFAFIVAALLAVLMIPASVSAVSETSRSADQNLGNGVWESTVYVTNSKKLNVRAHILRIDHDAGVALKVSTAQYYKTTSKTERANKAANWTLSDWGYATVANQAKTYQKTTGEEVIAASDGDFYSKDLNGQTLGKLIMEGNVVNPSTDEPCFFAVMKDGTYAILDAGASTDNVEEAVGGHYWILRDGSNVGRTDSDGDTLVTIGLTPEGDVFIVNVDGREPSSTGISGHDLAELMQQQGCDNAMILDCGGSASFLTKRSGDSAVKLRNIPNDGYGFARPVSSALLVAKKSGTSSAGAPAVSMKNDSTKLKKNSNGVYQYYVNGVKQKGFFMINNKPYLFNTKGNGWTKTVTIGKTKYYFKKGKYSKASDKKAGNIAIGFCGASNGGKNLIFAYQYGNKKLNIGKNPMIKKNSCKMKDWDNIIDVPWQSEKHRVKSVVVGSGVKNIGSCFLYISRTPFNDAVKKKKTALTSVSLPTSLKKIGAKSFFHHSKLKKITIPKNVATIGKNAFSYNESTTYTFKKKTPPSFANNSFKTSGKKTVWKVPKTKKWKALAKNKAKKKKIGFKGKIKYTK